MTTISAIVRAAIPDATDDDVEHVVWDRTAYPFKKLTAKDFFKAASGWRRASAKGVQLCDLCHRIATTRFACELCDAALNSARRAA